MTEWREREKAAIPTEAVGRYRSPDVQRGSEVDRSPIATSFSVDIKCINYFRFCRFTFGQNATLVRGGGSGRDELQRAQRTERGGRAKKDRIVTPRPKYSEQVGDNERQIVGHRRKGSHYATDIRTQENGGLLWSKRNSPEMG